MLSFFEELRHKDINTLTGESGRSDAAAVHCTVSVRGQVSVLMAETNQEGRRSHNCTCVCVCVGVYPYFYLSIVSISQ